MAKMINTVSKHLYIWVGVIIVLGFITLLTSKRSVQFHKMLFNVQLVNVLWNRDHSSFKHVSPPIAPLDGQNSNRVFTSNKLPENQELYPSVANGFIGTRIYSDTIYLSGVFNGNNLNSHRARIPSSLITNIDVLENNDLNHSYSLDTETGTFYHYINDKSKDWSIVQKVYAHQTYENLLISELDIENGNITDLVFTVGNFLGDESEDVNFQMKKTEGDFQLMSGKTRITERPSVKHIKIAMIWNSKHNTSKMTVAQNSQIQKIFATSISCDLETANPEAEARSNMIDALYIYKKNPSELWKRHAAAWQQIWNRGSIDVFGDNALAKAIYGSHYYIISSIRDDWPYGLSPGGLSSNAYLGHTFWDQETWMYPNLLLLHPKLAKSALVYRRNRLESAKSRAKAYGYKGAMFPWESSFSGFEVCPAPDPYSKYEHHITGDIGFALEQLWMTSHDIEWFTYIGLEMVTAIADFWVSRVTYSSTKLQYVINHVQGPDEYHYDINNSVYTNYIAKLNLKFATKLVKVLQGNINPEWDHVAEHMYIPYDTVLDYHPEYDGYNLNVTVKQADVILLGFPLMLDMNTTTRYNDLLYYEERTDPDGPAMTKSMFAIGWLECNKIKQAAESFKKGYANVRQPFQVWTETPEGGAVNFITGAGGFLQSILFGYGGIRIKDNRLEVNPILPPKATNVNMKGITYLGNNINISFDSKNMEFILIDCIEPCEILYLNIPKTGERYILTKESSIEFQKQLVHMIQS